MVDQFGYVDCGGIRCFEFYMEQINQVVGEVHSHVQC